MSPPDALEPKVTVEANLGGSDDVGGGSWRKTYPSSFWTTVSTLLRFRTLPMQEINDVPLHGDGRARSGSRARSASNSARGCRLQQSDDQPRRRRRFLRAAARTGAGPLDLPEDWRLVRGRDGESYRWPDERDRYKPYRVFIGTTRAEGAVQIGLGETVRKNKWGRDRKYVVAF